jgi:hypothetical protein
MSGYSDGAQRQNDMSEFATEFAEDEVFSSLGQEFKNVDIETSTRQARGDAKELTRLRGVYSYELHQAGLPHKQNKPGAQLRHLNNAYVAALYLDVRGMLPPPDTLKALQLRIKKLTSQEDQEK